MTTERNAQGVDVLGALPQWATHYYTHPGDLPQPCRLVMDPQRDGRVWVQTSPNGKSRPVQRAALRQVEGQ